MRTTKGFPRRLTAGLLSIVMLLSLLPALSTPAEAAQTDYAKDPTWYSLGTGPSEATELEALSSLLRHQHNNEAANEENEISSDYAGLDYLYTDDTLYIKLNTDIDVKFAPYYTDDRPDITLAASTHQWKYRLPVYGKKVLDLNGHKIKVQQEDDYHQAKDAVFMIKDGATLTIVDSQGGGKMIANSWIKMYLDLFHVQSGGELILNAPGATFECGYSEKVWLTGAYKNNEEPDGNDSGYFGYARNQASGTAVTVFGGGKLTVSGGTVKGRGHDRISKYGTDYYWHQNSEGADLRSCAAINAYANASVYIIDGNIYGMGGADALKIDKDAYLTIESGVFDTYKVDKIVLPKGDRDGYTTGEIAGGVLAGMFGFLYGVLADEKVDNYMDGTYGYVGIPSDKLAQLSAKGSAVEVITGDHDVSGDELSAEETTPSTKYTTERVTIRPKTGSATADSRVTIEPVNGMYSWNPRQSDSFAVNVSFNERYFSERARELAESNYRPITKPYSYNDKEYYLNYKFTLYDHQHGDEVTIGEKRLPADDTSVTNVNLAGGGSVDGWKYTLEDWKKLQAGKYSVRCEVTEVWKGEHTYKSAWYASMPLTIRTSDNDLLTKLEQQGFKPDFDINHTWCRGVIDGVPVMSLILTDETQAVLKETIGDYKDFNDVTVTYELWDYDPDGNTFEKLSQTVHVNEYTTLTSATSGAKVITVSIGIPHYGSLDLLTGYDYIEVSKNFLLLPPMYQDGTAFGYDKAVEVSGGKPATINFNVVSNSNVDALHYKGSFSWDWYFFAGGHDMYEGDGLTAENGYTKYSTATGLNGSYIKMELDGTYRLVCTYQPDKYGSPTQTFTSAPVDVVSEDESRVKVELEAREDKINAVDLEKTTLTLSWAGMTDEIESVQFSLKGRPNGVAYSAPVRADVSNQTSYTIKLSQFDSILDAEDPSGEYTFRAFVKGNSGEGYRPEYKVYSNDVTVKIMKAADGYALYANGQYLGAGQTTLGAAEAQAVPIYLDSTTRTVELSAKYFPTNATYDQRFADEDDIHYYWFVSEGSANISLPNDANHRVDHSVEATINRPGTAYIVCQKWANADTYSDADVSKRTTTYFKVCVPVTRVEFAQPNYQTSVGGNSYQHVLPSVTAYATCGASSPRDAAFAFTYSEEPSLNYAPVYLDNGTSSMPNKAIAANDKGSVIYKLHLADGLSYPLKKENDTDYVVDTSAVKLTVRTADGDVTKTADKWGVSDAGSVFSTGSAAPAPNQAYFQLTQDVFVEDRGAEYIDLVVISTTEPRVGDPINEKITVYTDGGYERYPQPVYGQYKAAEVFSLSNLKAVDTGNANLNRSIILPYESAVSKASAETAGAPYTDADGAKAETGKSSGNDAILNGNYENGTYFHELQLVTNKNTATDGKKYYFSPDCKIIMNGNLLDFGDRTMYNAKDGYSSLSFSYFFDVGEVNTVDELTLTGIKPQQGNEPAEPADVTATGFEFPSGGSKTANAAKVDVTKLIWFVDKNDNGRLDTGEEVKTEWKTTTNDKGKQEITAYDAEKSTLWWDGTFLPGVTYSALVEIATGDSATRMGKNVQFSCDGGTVKPIDQSSFVVKFDADNTIRTIHLPIPTGAAAASPDRDPLGLFNASNQGYTTTVSKVHKHKDSSDSMSSAANVSNFYDSGTDLSEQTLPKGKYWMILNFLPNNGCTFASDLKVLINGVDTGEFGYGSEQVKEMHVTSGTNYANVWRTFEVPAGETPSSGVLGDVNGDGKITADDLTMLTGHVAKIVEITDAKALSRSDVTKDGGLDANDLTRLTMYVAKIIDSFD